MKYRICWESKLTGYKGAGEFIFNSREDAKRMASEMNTKYPDVLHWVE